MTAVRVRDAVLLAGGDLALVRAAVAAAQRERARHGYGPHPRLAELARHLADAGQPDSPADPPGHDGPVPIVELTAAKAAELLGVSARTARRLAPELGGRKLAGAWLLDASAVTEHRGGTTA